MRIIGGSARGRKLRVPRGRSVRPTPDRVREALFDILAGSVEGCRFLDLYAGSGAVGLEALSRGAAGALFVERDPVHLRLLRENLQRTGLAADARVLGASVRRALSRLAREGRRFDLVFADPPYDGDRERQAVLSWLGRWEILPTGARIILELPARRPLPSATPLEMVREVRYGDTRLVFLRARRGATGGR